MKRYFFSEVDSTQTLLRTWTEREELPHGTLIHALHQRAGYGRRGSTWFSVPGESLTFSFLLRERIQPATLSVRVSLALYDTVRPYAGQTLTLKWPNDLWTLPDPTGKLAGILSEVRWERETPKHAIIGIGLNVLQRSFPPELRAASLAQIGTPPLMETLLDAFEEALRLWLDAPDERVRQAFLQRAWREGRLYGTFGGMQAYLTTWDETDTLYFETPSGLCTLSTALATDIWKPTLSA